MQGYAQLHRQSHRLLLRGEGRPAHRRGRFHRGGSGRAHRPADRPAQERQLPADRHHRPRRVGARAAQSVRGGAARSGARAVSRSGNHAADDGARLARRKARSGLLQARRQRRRQGNLGAGPQDAGVSPGAKGEIPGGGSRARHRGSGTAAARAGGGRRSRRTVSVEAVSRLRDLFGAHGAGDFGPHRGDRSRHALGLRVHARAVRTVGRARRAGDGGAHAPRRVRDSGERGAHAGIGRAELL